ncbi:MAG: AmmeMemoRadiSam system protein A [bacterium]
MLTEVEKKELVRIARQSLRSAVKRTPKPKLEPLTDTLKEQRGAFVTLKKHGNLRGCIGYIEAVKPLYLAVAEMAVSAGMRDPRFSPVEEDELPDVTIEISVLSPLKQVKGVEDIEVGRDGIYIVKHHYSGVLLPQVATEYKWDSETFLEETCLKAGLPTDAWRRGAKVYTFSAEIFGEESG